MASGDGPGNGLPNRRLFGPDAPSPGQERRIHAAARALYEEEREWRDPSAKWTGMESLWYGKARAALDAADADAHWKALYEEQTAFSVTVASERDRLLAFVQRVADDGGHRDGLDWSISATELLSGITPPPDESSQTEG